jgi:branched-chain amino acid aminotransferase
MCILCPVGPYYKSGSTVPVKLLADSKNVRAWPGGVGGVKVGGNYAPTIAVSAEAGKKGYSQVLWLFGPNHEITEVGAMNIFFLFRNDKDPNSALELVTAPLDRGDVLPGVTRDSIINLAKSEMIQDIVGHRLTVSERWLTIAEVQAAAANGTVSKPT